MSALLTPNLAELIAYLGVGPERIRMQPLPGLATEADVIRAEPWCELIDGILVERAMGYYESRLAAVLIAILENFLLQHDLGIILGEAGMMRVASEQVRMPDVAFYSWDHFPNRELPDEQILSVVPDLPVEILSPGNTKKEIDRKIHEYFIGGARLVWIVEPTNRTVEVYTSPDQSTLLDETQTLDGDDVLPGFSLVIGDWFKRAGRRA